MKFLYVRISLTSLYPLVGRNIPFRTPFSNTRALSLQLQYSINTPVLVYSVIQDRNILRGDIQIHSALRSVTDNSLSDFWYGQAKFEIATEIGTERLGVLTTKDLFYEKARGILSWSKHRGENYSHGCECLWNAIPCSARTSDEIVVSIFT
jgi:hypothetical protein